MISLDEKEAKEKSKEQLEQLFDRIKSMLPSEAEFVKAEYEGPDIVIYLKNAKAVYQDDMIVRGIASSVKKKLVIRSDDSHLMDPEKAKETITQLVPKEAVIASIRFMPVRCYVVLSSVCALHEQRVHSWVPHVC